MALRAFSARNGGIGHAVREDHSGVECGALSDWSLDFDRRLGGVRSFTFDECKRCTRVLQTRELRRARKATS